MEPLSYHSPAAGVPLAAIFACLLNRGHKKAPMSRGLIAGVTSAEVYPNE